MPKIATTDDEILRCFDVMAELRPHLIKEDFLPAIKEMEQEGYRLLYLEDNSEIAAVAGFRISTNLYMGKHLYVDDLVTSKNQRSKGHGETLISWLRTLAKKEKCEYFDLDSGTHRGRAHKFYFEQGFTIASYHFSEKLEDS